MNHLTEEQFVLYYYGEGDESPAVRAHLDTCEACRAEYASLQRVLNVVDSAPVPERDANYGAQVWRRLQPSLKWNRPPGLLRWNRPPGLLRWNRPPGLFWWLWPVRHWAAAMLVATLIVAAFLAGRYYPKSQPNAPTANAGQVRERILLVAVGDHLDRSQAVLLEVVNAQPGQSLDVSSERERAGDLVADNRLYRQTAAHAGDTRVASVLDDLEPVLLEIAHGPDLLTPEQVENLRQRIEGDGILFKVRVAGSTVRHREEKAAPSAMQNTL
jgi:anti-sigma factor RsiW